MENQENLKANLDKKLILYPKTMEQAIIEAELQIEAERTDEQLGLYCRWNDVNSANLKYWRFNNVTMLAGSSGSGKSFILNMLEDDFTNKELNKNFKHSILILAFKYEMDAADEVTRTVASKLKKSYSYLLSSEWQTESKNYNKIDEKELNDIKIEFEKIKHKPILYFETSGNLNQLEYTVDYYAKIYTNRKLIITIDHTLLSQKVEEYNDLELMSNTALCAIRLRKKYKAMIILLNQLNAEIEKPIRRENPLLQYPVKSDIHCGNQVFWACDNVIIAHRPELLGIEKYGKQKYPSKDLLHFAVIKSRKGRVGNIWLKAKLSQSEILAMSSSQLNEEKNIDLKNFKEIL